MLIAVILTSLIVTVVFQQGHGEVTFNITNGYLVQVTDVPADTSLILCFDGSLRKSEVYVQAVGNRTIMNYTICNTTFHRYQALMWPIRGGLPTRAHFLDYGQMKMDYMEMPYPNINDQLNKVHSVYSDDNIHHFRYRILNPASFSYDIYWNNIRKNLILDLPATPVMTTTTTTPPLPSAVSIPSLNQAGKQFTITCNGQCKDVTIRSTGPTVDMFVHLATTPSVSGIECSGCVCTALGSSDQVQECTVASGNAGSNNLFVLLKSGVPSGSSNVGLEVTAGNAISLVATN